MTAANGCAGHTTGVYSITNAVDGKVYVGSTAKSFSKRWNVHRCLLRKGNHHSKHLQAAWNLQGESNFVFEVIVETDPNSAIDHEQYWINMLRSNERDYGYNSASVAGSMLGFKHSLETVLEIKRRNSQWRPTEEMIRRSVEGRKGYKHPESSRLKMGLARRGRSMPWSPESRAKLADTMRLITVLPAYAATLSQACAATDLLTGEVTIYPSVSATIAAGYTSGAVSRALRRTKDYPRGVHKGKRWDYVNRT